MKKAILLLMLVLLLTACTTTKISDIKENPEKYLGKKVIVSGTARNVIKLGDISGFSLEQDGARISVGSSRLPAEGDNIVVKGVVVKDAFLGYFIMAESYQIK